MIRSIQRHVGYKITLVVGILGCISLASLMLFYTRHMERSLLAQNEHHLLKLTDSTSRAVESIMLAGYADVAEDYAARLRDVENLVDFRILRTNGLEAFQDNQTIEEVNRRTGSEDFLSRDEEVEIAVMASDDEHLLRAVDILQPVHYTHAGEDGEELLTYVMPIPNREECHECHGGAQQARGVVKLTTSLAGVRADIARATTESFSVMAIAVACFMTLVGLLLHRMVTAPLRRVRGAIEVIAHGNLTARVRGGGRHLDEVGQIGAHVNSMTQSLRNTIRTVSMESRGLLACVKEFVLINEKLNESSRDTHCIAENVVALNRSLGEEISDIRDSVKEAAIDVVSSSVDRLSSSVTTIASNAEQASENVETMSVEAGEMRQIIVDVNANLEQVGSLVSGVAKSIEEMDASLNEVRERCRISGTESRDALRSAKEATDVIHRLADSTKEIGRVLNAISTIAQQTKLLALNASIEAAHAGSAGRGFAIVAQQVKELSMQTKDATDMIAGLVKEIGAGTDEAIRAISSMADLNERIDENAQEIAESIEQQSTSTTEIRHSIEAVTDSTALVMGDARAVRQKSEIVAGAAGTAAQKTDDIARLTAGAAEAAADIARKTREARAFIMNILESAEKTDAVSKVVSENLGDAFHLAATMRSLVMSMNSMVEIVRDVSGTLHEVQTGLDVGDAAFDIEEVKGDYLRWMVDLQGIANDPDSARSAELRARALGRGALREWIEANAGTATATHPRFEDIVEGERRTHELIVETLESAGRDDPGACRDRVAAYLDAQRRLFADLDVLYQTMDASVSPSAQIPQAAPVAESPAPAREPAYVA